MEHLKIKLSDELFKLKDPRVQRVLSGRMSVEAFALLVRPGDPYVLIGDTIYPLTEQEFYALRAVMPMNIMTDKVFRWVIDQCPDISYMREKDRKFIEKIRQDLPSCPACRYNRYRDEVYKLVKSYDIKLPAELMGKTAHDTLADKAEYPETTGPLAPVAFAMMNHMYAVPLETRKPCIDCVEKHLAQAWILSREALQGYPEYASMVVGHLGEAIDEMPKELHELKQTVEFCLARTNYRKVPFVPLMLMAPMLTYARNDMDRPVDEMQDVDAAETAMDLEFTPEAIKELDFIKEDQKLCKCVIEEAERTDNFILGVENSDERRIAWQGAMGCLADHMADIAPKTAGIIRNRRLLFHVEPRLCLEANLTLADFRKLLGAS